MSEKNASSQSKDQTKASETEGKTPSRRTLKAEGRKKRTERLKKDPEFAKTYFEAKAKRSETKKKVFRQKKNRKKK